MKRQGAKLTNLTKGGEGRFGHPQSAETRAKIGAHFRGKKLTPEHVAKVRAALKGHAVTDEQRAKMRAAKLGTKQSEETKVKRAAALRGMKRSPESLARMSAAQVGIPKANPHNFRKVRCECGMVSNPGAIGKHRRSTGHELAT